MPIRRLRKVKKVLASKPVRVKKQMNSLKNKIPDQMRRTNAEKIRDTSEAAEESSTDYPMEPSEDVVQSGKDLPELDNSKISEMNSMIKVRYSELLHELWENENAVNDMEVTPQLKKLLNQRSKLWLEYFISTYTFNNYKNLDIFNYMDAFNNSTNYL